MVEKHKLQTYTCNKITTKPCMVYLLIIVKQTVSSLLKLVDLIWYSYVRFLRGELYRIFKYSY